jgi:hypothetical protein
VLQTFQATTYAKQFGFAPHNDYKKAACVFGGLKAAEDLDGFTFGRDGKPCYIPSHNHDESDIQLISSKLERVCGKNDFYLDEI